MCARAVTHGDDFDNMDGYDYDSIFETYDDYYRERPDTEIAYTVKGYKLLRKYTVCHVFVFFSTPFYFENGIV
jgi:hypothetical protein